MGADSEIAVAEAVVDVLRGRRPPGVIATVVGRGGSAPQVLGAKLLYFGPEEVLGTVGGGAIEQVVLDACETVLKSGRPQTVSKDLMRDLGMCCGGQMEVFVERVQARLRLHLVGAGHVAQAVAQVAVVAGYEVHVYDDRDPLLEHAAFVDSTVHSAEADEVSRKIATGDARDAFLIMTRDHLLDEQALADVVLLPHAYVGMIGSRRKVYRVFARMLRRFDERGLTRPDMSKVRAPIGLDLGGRTPGEIAVSVMAELLAARHGGSANSMSVVQDAVERAGEIEG
jgi:xanthine dehydrogenase accessory factor